MLFTALVEVRGFRAREKEVALDFGYFVGNGYECDPIGFAVDAWVALLYLEPAKRLASACFQFTEEKKQILRRLSLGWQRSRTTAPRTFSTQRLLPIPSNRGKPARS